MARDLAGWLGRCAAFCVLVVLVLLALTRAADAHQVGLSRGDYVLTGDRVAIEIYFSQRELAVTLPALDEDGDGQLTAQELANGGKILDREVFARLAVMSGGQPCTAERSSAQIVGEDVVLGGYATCPAGARDLELTFGFLAPFAAGHRHLAHVRAGVADQETVAVRSAATVRVDAGHPIESSGGTWAYVKLGVEHILTGYDHLVFLFGLVVIGGRMRGLLKAVTAFTIAHSVSLALAVLGAWTPSPRLIEPAIALSIAYIGVENFYVKDAEKRWRITLPFGFVHGFGFAAALVERHLPRSRIPMALLGFNAGVELGQLGVLAVLLPLLTLARRSAVMRTRGLKVANVLIILLGLGWLVVRMRDAWR
jgi:hydrogenase/urease accessory protein HupE